MKIQKRDGRVVDFDIMRVKRAVELAMAETGNISDNFSTEISKSLQKRIMLLNETTLSVEVIQDMVEDELLNSIRKDVAKKYILYRETRTKNRKKPNKTSLLTDDFISKYKHMANPMNQLGEFVYYRTYSRWLEDEGRRERWYETVRRSVEYNCSITGTTTREEAEELYDNMFNLKQFLSGRTMWVGGTEVALKYPIANFNCSFTTIRKVEDFVELFYLLMLGCGVGVRILKEDVVQIPKFRSTFEVIHKKYTATHKDFREDMTSIKFNGSTATIIVGDSKTGWVDGLKFFLEIATKNDYQHINTIVFDYNNVRPQGEKLKTFGGTASGHEALMNMYSKIDAVIKKVSDSNRNKKMKPIDALDICNIIGEGVVVGGVRRTAEIALFDSDDEECIKAKSELYRQVEGQWITNADLLHRQMSNNSIYYKNKPSREKLHWQIEQMRYSGEPAFVNDVAGSKRREGFEGVNPCAEILLRSKGLCNLTTVNVMAFVLSDNTLDIVGLRKALKLSVRAGFRMTIPELELPEWNHVQNTDRLLGCSVTGWQDMINATNMTEVRENNLLNELKTYAREVADSYATALGLNKPMLITTVKPEGTLSQLAGVSSGIHYSHSPYYIRRVRINANDPLVKVCEELGYPVKPEVGQDWDTCKTKVVEFPSKAPKGRTKYDVSAIEQLENYMRFMEHYVDHNVSITVHVRADEWEGVEQWMWDNWDDVVAVSFISLDESFYELLPYESITEEEYNSRVKSMKKFIPSLLSKYEVKEEELDTGASECSNGVCPLR